MFKKDIIAVKTLENMLKNDKLSHAYLIIGEDSLYSEKFILKFVKSIVCLNNESKSFYSCDECKNCRSVDNDNFIDFYKIISDETTIKKDDVKLLKSEFKVKSFYGKKIYWIKDIEKMTTQASNSILKFLEEPDDNIIAILSCKNLSAVLPTIISRCQKIRLSGREELKNSNYELYIEYIRDFSKQFNINKNMSALYLLERLKTKEEIVEFFDVFLAYIDSIYITAEEGALFNISSIQEKILKSKADIESNVSAVLVLEKFIFSLILDNNAISF